MSDNLAEKLKAKADAFYTSDIFKKCAEEVWNDTLIYALNESANTGNYVYTFILTYAYKSLSYVSYNSFLKIKEELIKIISNEGLKVEAPYSDQSTLRISWQ